MSGNFLHIPSEKVSSKPAPAPIIKWVEIYNQSGILHCSKELSNMFTRVTTYNSPRVSIVIPTLNEAENLPHVLPNIPEWVDEIILVDGCSSDNTVDVARQLWPGIQILEQDGCGKGAALRQGFQAATGDIIVMMDADGSTNPMEIPAFIAVLVAGADFVKGSRFLQGGGSEDITPIRKIGNWGLLFLVRTIFGCQYSDLCYGFNAFWAQHLPRLNPDTDGFEIETKLNLRALTSGLKVAEVPSFEAKRIHGKSHLRAIPDGIRVLRTIFKEWFESRLLSFKHLVLSDQGHQMDGSVHSRSHLLP
jgi:glycosyltransferase involved in cell wall biosynthesis